MKLLSYETVEIQIKRANQLSTNPKTPEQRKFWEKEFLRTFTNWSEETFILCMDKHFERLSFFPTIKDLYDSYEHVELQRRNKQLMLPSPRLDDRQPDTPEARKNRKRIEKIVNQITSGKRSWNKKTLFAAADEMTLRSPAGRKGIINGT